MLRIVTSLFVALTLALAVAPAASAQNHPAAIVAVMDSQKILRDSKAGQSVARQIKDFADTFQGMVKREEEALRQRQQELRNQSAILAPEVLEQRRQELQKTFNEAQKLIQDRRVSIDRTRQQALEVIKQQILEIIEELQKEKKFNLVLDRSAYSWVLPELVITEEIVRRLDQRLPSVKVARPDGF